MHGTVLGVQTEPLPVKASAYETGHIAIINLSVFIPNQHYSRHASPSSRVIFTENREV